MSSFLYATDRFFIRFVRFYIRQPKLSTGASSFIPTHSDNACLGQRFEIMVLF